jgi:hypothetical protein
MPEFILVVRNKVAKPDAALGSRKSSGCKQKSSPWPWKRSVQQKATLGPWKMSFGKVGAQVCRGD